MGKSHPANVKKPPPVSNEHVAKGAAPFDPATIDAHAKAAEAGKRDAKKDGRNV